MSKQCCVTNCQKKVEEGQYKIIGDKIYCIQCAIIIYKELLYKMGLPI